MAFEELLCPSMFTGKKKYCGVMYKPNQDGSFDGIIKQLKIKDILLKGIDFIKSQYPQIIKDRGNKTILDILQHFNSRLMITNKEQQVKYFKDDTRSELNEILISIVITNTE